MTSVDLKTWPPLLATVALLVAGAWIYQEGANTTGAALLGAGLVVLGAWLATILRSDEPNRPLEEETVVEVIEP